MHTHAFHMSYFIMDNLEYGKVWDIVHLFTQVMCLAET